MKKLKSEMLELSEEQKEELRKEKESEIHKLLDFDNRPEPTNKNDYKEMSMDEFVNHPLFMKPDHIPTQEEIDNNEFLASIQAMKYSETDTPDIQAEEFKKDGTFHFKHKLYKKAILAYSKAITVKPMDKKLLASCYNNRAASEYFLKNYRNAINDSGRAVALDQNYIKSWIRIFDCCQKLKLWNEGLSMVEIAYDKIKDRNEETNKKLRDYRDAFLKSKKETERQKRKMERIEQKRIKAEIDLITKIRNSGVKLELNCDQDDEDDDDEKRRKVLSAIETHQSNIKVHLNESSGMLVWPVMFVYPEYGQTDFVQQFQEDITLGTMLTELFPEGEPSPPWDLEQKYVPSKMTVWVENRKIQSIFQIDINAPLNSALRDKNCYVQGGCPSFIITIFNSPFEKSFKRKYHLT